MRFHHIDVDGTQEQMSLVPLLSLSALKMTDWSNVTHVDWPSSWLTRRQSGQKPSGSLDDPVNNYLIGFLVRCLSGCQLNGRLFSQLGDLSSWLAGALSDWLLFIDVRKLRNNRTFCKDILYWWYWLQSGSSTPRNPMHTLVKKSTYSLSNYMHIKWPRVQS